MHGYSDNIHNFVLFSIFCYLIVMNNLCIAAGQWALALLCVWGLMACGTGVSSEETTYVALDTSEGEIVLMLYNETPLHRDHFVKNVKEGLYNGMSFNRVIADFMVQCGEEEAEDVVPAEICYPKRFHKRGALAMGRCTDDKELRSASRQFYIVWGKLLTEE